MMRERIEEKYKILMCYFFALQGYRKVEDIPSDMIEAIEQAEKPFVDGVLTAIAKELGGLPSEEECQVFARKHLIGFTEYQIENGKRIYRWLKENAGKT